MKLFSVSPGPGVFAINNQGYPLFGTNQVEAAVTSLFETAEQYAKQPFPPDRPLIEKLNQGYARARQEIGEIAHQQAKQNRGPGGHTLAAQTLLVAGAGLAAGIDYRSQFMRENPSEIPPGSTLETLMLPPWLQVSGFKNSICINARTYTIAHDCEIRGVADELLEKAELCIIRNVEKLSAARATPNLSVDRAHHGLKTLKTAVMKQLTSSFWETNDLNVANMLLAAAHGLRFAIDFQVLRTLQLKLQPHPSVNFSTN